MLARNRGVWGGLFDNLHYLAFRRGGVSVTMNAGRLAAASRWEFPSLVFSFSEMVRSGDLISRALREGYRANQRVVV